MHVRSGDDDRSACCSTATRRGSPLADPTAPVVVNAGGHGFYRVAYTTSCAAGSPATALAGLDTLERYNLVDDAWNEVVAGRLDGGRRS